MIDERDDAELDDAELVEHVREGDEDAALILWSRSEERERAAITAVVTSPEIADGVLRRGFAQVLSEIRSDTDPLASFDVYLRTSLLFRARFDGTPRHTLAPVVRAFAGLRRLDQLSLWESVLDHVGIVDLPRTGGSSHRSVTPPVVESLERLRVAWLAEILDVPSLSPTCAWLTERIDVLQCDSTAPASADRFRRHVASCARCALLVDEYSDLPLNLVDGLAPQHARAQGAPSH